MKDGRAASYRRTGNTVRSGIDRNDAIERRAGVYGVPSRVITERKTCEGSENFRVIESVAVSLYHVEVMGKSTG